jgi:YVTN family beta-propeller protein
VPDVASLASVDLGAAAWRTTYGFDAVWIQVDPPVDQLIKVDAASGEITLRLDGATSAAVADDAMWVTVAGETTRKIDPVTGDVLASASTPGSYYVAVGAGAVWVPDSVGVTRIDPASGGIVATIPVEGGVSDLYVADDAVWITQKDAGNLLRIDPTTNLLVASLHTGAGAHAIAVDEHGVWVANYRAGTVSRVDPSTNTVIATIDRVGSGVGLTSGNGSIYASQRGVGIFSIDPVTNEATLIASTHDWNYGLSYGNGALWISSVDAGKLFVLPDPG